MEEFPQLSTARAAFAGGKTRSIEFRSEQLRKLWEMLDDRESREMIYDAVYKDIKRCTFDAAISDILGVKVEIANMLRNMNRYLKPREFSRNLLAITDKSKIRLEPRGVVLIIGTWNYPFYISLRPLVGAIAAGNCALVKPSEIACHSAQVMAQIIPKYLDNDCYHIVLGDVERTKALLRHKFDYIFFTGSTNVGKKILEAAAEHLTPVTLELGGKSPVYMEESACSKVSVKRIVWGKLVNFGQTCVAPDYLVCTKDVQEEFIKHTKEILIEWYGSYTNLHHWKQFPRIINSQNFNRIKRLLEATAGTVRIGGGYDEKDLWIDPTFVSDVRPGDSLLSDEIFGPILPIVTVSSTAEAISIMNSMGTPLALYVFSKDEKIVKKMLDSVPSGGACINDVIFQFSDLRVPFGGLGTSGFGMYIGKYTLETFSHKRGVLSRGLDCFSEKLGTLRYPPFSEKKRELFEKIFIIKENFDLTLHPFVTHFLVFLVGCLLAFIALRCPMWL